MQTISRSLNDTNSSGTLSAVRNAAHDTADAVAEGAQRVGQAVDSAGREIGDAAAHQAARIGDSMREWLDHQGDVARHMATRMRHEASAIAEGGERYVRTEPVKSVLIAAAAGALVTGLLLLLRRRQ